MVEDNIIKINRIPLIPAHRLTPKVHHGYNYGRNPNSKRGKGNPDQAGYFFDEINEQSLG